MSAADAGAAAVKAIAKTAAISVSILGKFTMVTKITSIRAAGGGLVAKGVVIGKLNAGGR